MRILATEITKSGFTYRQICRENNVAVYAQFMKGQSGTPLAYETIIIKEHGEYVLGGTTIEAGEAYPGNEKFGILGWSYSTLIPEARKISLDKMNQVLQSEMVKDKERKDKTI